MVPTCINRIGPWQWTSAQQQKNFVADGQFSLTMLWSIVPNINTIVASVHNPVHNILIRITCQFLLKNGCIKLDGSHKHCSIISRTLDDSCSAFCPVAKCDLVDPTDEACCRVATSSDSGSNMASFGKMDGDQAPSGEEGTDVAASNEVTNVVAFSSNEVVSEVMPSAEVAGEIVHSPNDVASEAMPSAKVAIEVIMSDNAGDGAMMTSDGMFHR